MSDFMFDRRDLLKLIGSVIVCDHLYAYPGAPPLETPVAPSDYQPRFLSVPEYQLVSELCQIIIPADTDSPGAIEAGVPWFIDTVLLYADAKRQGDWRSGLAGIDELSRTLHGNTFLLCSASQRAQVVENVSRNEDSPSSPGDRFFCEIKALTVEAFCLSDMGMKDYLHYRGNVSMSDFPGCPTKTTVSL